MKNILIATLLVIGCTSFSLTNPSLTECANPSIFENIKSFKLPLDDVKNLLANQISSQGIQPISGADKVSLFQIVYKTQLLSSQQTVQPENPLKAKVTNNQTRLVVTYQVNLTEGIRPKTTTFSATTTIDNIKIVYNKQFTNGLYTFGDVNFIFTADMMKTIYKTNPDSKQLEKINPVITGSNSSLFTSLKALLDDASIKKYMQNNVKTQKLSRVYQTNPYFYSSDPVFSTNVDVSTKSVSSDPQTKNLVNGVLGGLSSGVLCPTFVPNFIQNPGNMFITSQFISNLIQTAIVSHPGWKSIVISKSTIRTDLFQFLLFDLQYVVDGLFNDQLSQYMQNQLTYTCSVNSNVAQQFDTQKNVLYQTVDFKCTGNVMIGSGKTIKVMDFQPTIKYTVKITVDNSLTVFMDNLELVKVNYNIVDGKYKVSDQALAQRYIQTIFWEFRTYTIGTHFNVGQGNSKVLMAQNNAGIWIF